jgi:4-amino-4-deoxy-L-arabinose transferase-like glycosyltransferase
MANQFSVKIVLSLLVAAFLLLSWNISSQDLIGDEATYSFRSIGYLDYLGTSFQTQPIDWYAAETLPWWTRLSFHDHPPLGFLIPHLFFRVFGDSIFIAKLPSLLAGVGSLWLLFLIIRKMLSEEAAIAAVIVGLVSNVFISVFRTSLLEPLLLFFILLNIWCFFRFVESDYWRKKYWWIFGGTFGLALLTKYTGGFLALLYAIYTAVYHRSLLKKPQWYAAAIAAILVFSPVIIYNVYLYQDRGHFDLQFAYLFGQSTPEWSGLLGKIQSPFSDIGRNVYAYYGIAALLLGGVGIAYALWNRGHAYVFWLFYILSVTVLLFKIGSANRFLALYWPAVSALGGAWIAATWLKINSQWQKYAIGAAAISLLLGSSIFTVKNNFFTPNDYGVAALDRYFESEFGGKESAVIPESDNPHLNEVMYRFADQKSNAPKDFFLIVYNDNVALSTLEWIFYRRFFYHNIPALYTENFIKTLRVFGESYFKGFKIYFVQSTEYTDLNPFKRENTFGNEFEQQLIARGLKPEKTIYGKDGNEMFRVYKFSL